MRELWVDGFDLTNKVKVKIRSKRGIEVGGREKI